MKAKKEGNSESKNKPDNYNMLPKNLGEMDLRISWGTPFWNASLKI